LAITPDTYSSMSISAIASSAVPESTMCSRTSPGMGLPSTQTRPPARVLTSARGEIGAISRPSPTLALSGSARGR